MTMSLSGSAGAPQRQMVTSSGLREAGTTDSRRQRRQSTARCAAPFAPAVPSKREERLLPPDPMSMAPPPPTRARPAPRPWRDSVRKRTPQGQRNRGAFRGISSTRWHCGQVVWSGERPDGVETLPLSLLPRVLRLPPLRPCLGGVGLEIGDFALQE